MRLYHAPNSRSQRVLWLLEETGAPYELAFMGDRASRLADPAHMAKHPLGRVPALDEDGGTLFETAAICLQIADRHPEAGLIPAVGTHERGLVYQWVLFAANELEARLGQLRLFPDSEASRAGLAEAIGVVDNALDGHDYLVGDRFTVADLLISVNLASARRQGFAELSPRLAAYLEAMDARPAKQRAEDRNPPA